jgi:hypothetical protein
MTTTIYLAIWMSWSVFWSLSDILVTKVAQNGLSEASKKAPSWQIWSIPDPLDWNFGNNPFLHMTKEWLHTCFIRKDEEPAGILDLAILASIWSEIHVRWPEAVVSTMHISRLLLARIWKFWASDISKIELGIEWSTLNCLWSCFWKSALRHASMVSLGR